MPALGSDVVEGGREGKPPFKMRCPVCGGRITAKGDCLNLACLVYSVKGGSTGRRRRPESIVWCSSPRLKPLSNEELRILMEPYLTPSVERLLNR